CARLFLMGVGRGPCSLLVKERYSKGTIRFLLKKLNRVIQGSVCITVNAYRAKYKLLIGAYIF
ncbi:MAG: hypothetical protein E6929_15750, partial [Clostridium sp.]|nr:hypothetical protein [Clostridium sp.]